MSSQTRNWQSLMCTATFLYIWSIREEFIKTFRSVIPFGFFYVFAYPGKLQRNLNRLLYLIYENIFFWCSCLRISRLVIACYRWKHQSLIRYLWLHRYVTRDDILTCPPFSGDSETSHANKYWSGASFRDPLQLRCVRCKYLHFKMLKRWHKQITRSFTKLKITWLPFRNYEIY